MAGFIAKFAVGKVVGDKLEDKYGPENPKYTSAVGLDGRLLKVKREPPPGLSTHDAAVLAKVRRKAWKYEWRFDCSCCCGIHVQFGTVNIWSLIPIVGDFICLLKALTLVWAARKVEGGLPFRLKLKMLIWCAIDFVIKLVPVLGDLLTAVIKPNTRNCYAVERHLRRKGEKYLKAAGLPIPRPDAPPPAGAARPVEVQPPLPPRNGMRYDAADATLAAQGGAVKPPPPHNVRGGRSFLFWRSNDDWDGEQGAAVEARR